eukprot:2836470-Rhodomonas_salina.1
MRRLRIASLFLPAVTHRCTISDLAVAASVAVGMGGGGQSVEVIEHRLAESGERGGERREEREGDRERGREERGERGG